MKHAASLAALLVTMTALIMTVAAGPAAALTTKDYEVQVFKRTNVKRDSKDLTLVKHNAFIDRYAESWAAKLASEKKLVHRSSSSLRSILRECDLSSIGENLATGYSTGNNAVTGWMNSSGHRANLLKTSFRWHGVGAVKSSTGRWYVVQLMARS